LFLYRRAFDDCLDRLTLIKRDFGSALLVGCPAPEWRQRLLKRVGHVAVADPGPLFAEAATGEVVIEDQWHPAEHAFDLCIAIGTLDSVSDLPRALLAIRSALRKDALLLGAVAGGDTLPSLRRALHAADQVMGASSPHVHPRLEAASLASLLSQCGFAAPVVDLDRVQVSYQSLSRLVDDLRRMGTTNVLANRSKRPLSRQARAAAEGAFTEASTGSGTTEKFEILHFAAWVPT
jgi:hypothetical protein